MIPVSLDASWYRDKLTRSGVPEHMHDGYVRYILQGIVSRDSFLYAVLTNNLRDACGRADALNLPALDAHIGFLVYHAPAFCWGSPERVTTYVQSFHEESA